MQSRVSVIYRSILLAVIFALALLGISADAQPRAIVLYPEMRQPYAKVFEDIIAGISVSFPGELAVISVEEAHGGTTYSTWADIAPDVVIALGNRSYEVASASVVDIPLVLAGVSSDSRLPYPGISVLPDPMVVIAHLQLLAPVVNKLHVLVRESSDRDYASLISSAAEQQKIEMILHECSDFRDCAESVRRITALNLNRRHGLWLADPAAVDNSILGLILESAWRNRFVVASNNPAHVRRGVLFALYPNNLKMGESLGKLANHVVIDGNALNGIEPLRDVSLAVNLRTSNHIGLVFDRHVRSQIDLAFPSD